MVENLKIGDEVRTQANLVYRDYKSFKDIPANHVKNRRINLLGKVVAFSVDSKNIKVYLVQHNSIKVKLSSLQQKEISQFAVYFRDELILLDPTGNPRKENALISWLRT